MNQDWEVIGQLAHAIATATEEFRAGRILEEELPTAAGLARRFNLRTENVKKKLRTLRNEDLIHATGFQPKRYRFNPYPLKFMDETSPFYTLFRIPESPYFIEI